MSAWGAGSAMAADAPASCAPPTAVSLRIGGYGVDIKIELEVSFDVAMNDKISHASSSQQSN